MLEETDSLAERLRAAQEKARRARCEAFVEYDAMVAGERIGPITLETYNSLIAFENAFVTGGSVGFDDIANFIWVHHPRFGQFNRAEKKRVTRRVFSALRPAFPTTNEVVRLLAQFPRLRVLRCVVRPSAEERVAAVVTEIRRLLAEATDDLPTSDVGGEPIPFAFQAYVLNLFRRTLGMPFEETRRLPLRQLAQHYREIVHRESKGKALLLTREEAAIWREYLGGHPAV